MSDVTPEIQDAINLLVANGWTVLPPAQEWLEELARRAVAGDTEDRRRYLEALAQRRPARRVL